jgi:hypothetical protein
MKRSFVRGRISENQLILRAADTKPKYGQYLMPGKLDVVFNLCLFSANLTLKTQFFCQIASSRKFYSLKLMTNLIKIEISAQVQQAHCISYVPVAAVCNLV